MSLLLLTDDLMTRSMRDTLRIPMHFVSFACVEGKMFRAYRNTGTFILPHQGRSAVLGALFTVTDFAFYARILDSYYACSLSALRRNHARDYHHRLRVSCTPITFNSLQELGRGIYDEREAIDADCYFGNPQHPKIRSRFIHKQLSYRIVDGVSKASFKALYEEVRNGQL